MSIRCKMRLDNIFAQIHGGFQVNFRCEYDPQIIAEDRGFAKATPNGMAQFHIDNPKAVEQLVIGQAYYFDINPVPAKE